jgi:hypothetical protein
VVRVANAMERVSGWWLIHAVANKEELVCLVDVQETLVACLRRCHPG